MHFFPPKKRQTGIAFSYFIAFIGLLAATMGSYSYFFKPFSQSNYIHNISSKMEQQLNTIHQAVTDCAMLFPLGNNGTGFNVNYPGGAGKPIKDLECPGSSAANKNLWAGVSSVSITGLPQEMGEWLYSNNAEGINIVTTTHDSEIYKQVLAALRLKFSPYQTSLSDRIFNYWIIKSNGVLDSNGNDSGTSGSAGNGGGSGSGGGSGDSGSGSGGSGGANGDSGGSGGSGGGSGSGGSGVSTTGVGWYYDTPAKLFTSKEAAGNAASEEFHAYANSSSLQNPLPYRRDFILNQVYRKYEEMIRIINEKSMADQLAVLSNWENDPEGTQARHLAIVEETQRNLSVQWEQRTNELNYINQLWADGELFVYKPADTIISATFVLVDEATNEYSYRGIVRRFSGVIGDEARWSWESSDELLDLYIIRYHE